MKYLPYLLGMLIGLLTFGCGIWVGRKITLDTIEQGVTRAKAKLLLDQAEVRRMSIGRTAGLIDGDGHTIKLLTPSALRRLSEDELRDICIARGIVTSYLSRDGMIGAISQHQRSIMPDGVNLV